MGSVYKEISRLETAKQDIETAIEYCGVNVPDSELISTYANYIRQIPSAVFSQLNADLVGGTDMFISSIKQTNGIIEATAGGLVSASYSGLVPKIGTTAADTIATPADEWVLTSTKGAQPTWRKLPANAFKNDDNNTTYILSGTLNGNAYDVTLTPSNGNATGAKVPAMGAASSSAAGTAGLVPAPAKNKHTSFLRGDGTWAVPANDTYSVMTGATASAAGTSGLVPQPAKGDQGKFLSGAGTWTALPSLSITDSESGNAVTDVEVSGHGITLKRGTTFSVHGHKHSSDDITDLTRYVKATTASAIATTDSLNTALGKLELKADTAYSLVKGAYDGDGTIENLAEILKVLEGISDTDTIQAIVGKYLPLAGGMMTGNITFDANRLIRWHQSDSYSISCPNTSTGAYILIKGFEGTTINKRLSVYKTATSAPNGSYNLYTDGSLYAASAVFGAVNLGSGDLAFKGSDPGDIAWYDANNNEKGRIYYNSGVLSLRHDAGTTYPLLHGGNAYISNGVITINGVSITPLTSKPSYAWSEISYKPTLPFISNKLHSASSSGTYYYKLGTLPTSSSSTGDSFIIRGTVGSYGSAGKSHIDVSVGRRDGITFKGFIHDMRSSVWNLGVNNAGEIILIISSQYAAWSLELHSLQGTIDYTGEPYTPADTNITYITNSSNVAKFTNAGNAVMSDGLGGYASQLGTKNTSDTWVPVLTRVNGVSVMQYREIPAAYNNAPSTLSVNYANSAEYATSAGTATNATLLNNVGMFDGWDGIPCFVGGVMEAGRYIDFKYTKDAHTSGKDYSTRLECYGNNGNRLKLPTTAGTLARIEDLPTVNNATVTIKQNGTSLGSFTLNQVGSTEFNLTDTTYTSLKNPNSISFTNTAGTAVSYDGSSALDLTAGVNYATSASVWSSSAVSTDLNTVENKHGWVNGSGSAGNLPSSSSAGTVVSFSNSSSKLQFFGGYKTTHDLYYRKWYNSSWESWRTILDSSNWTSFISIPSVGNGTVTINQGGTSKGSFTLNQSTAATINLNDTNYYPKAFSWTNGTTSGPTGSLTGVGMSAVSFGAIPSASTIASGIVTTGSQVFAGQKTFNEGIRVGSTTAQQSTDATKIYFGDGSYVWIGEASEDDSMTLHCGSADKINFQVGTNVEAYVSSSGVYSVDGFFETSDERLKNILKPVKINLDDLSKLRKIYYTWKDIKSGDKLQIGMVAQEVQKLYPELVGIDSNTGFLSLAYDKLSVVALEAIDVIYGLMKNLKQENLELKIRLEKLEKMR